MKVQICDKLRTRWTFSRAVNGVRRHLKAHLCPSVGKDQRQLIPSYHHQLGGTLSGTQCSFVDEIKLNYSLVNTTDPSYVCSCCHIKLCTLHCTVSVKCLLVNHSDTTSSSVFSHHTGIRPEGGSSEPNEPLPGSATALCPVVLIVFIGCTMCTGHAKWQHSPCTIAFWHASYYIM